MTIEVSKSLYSKEVLLKTAYSFTDKVFLHLEQTEKYWVVSWKPRTGQNIDEGELENELVSQALREKLVEQTADLRKIILARALASTVMDDQPGDINIPLPIEETSLDTTIVSEKEKEEILRGWFDGQ